MTQSEIAYFTSLVPRIVDGRTDFEYRWLDDHNWAAVPMFSRKQDDGDGPFFDAMEADRIARAANEAGCRELVLIPLDNTGDEQMPRRLPADAGAVFEWGESASPGPWLLLAENISFAILCASRYTIVAGSRHLVSCTVGSGVRAAWDDFYSDASDEETPAARERMLKAASRYLWRDGIVLPPIEDEDRLRRLRLIMSDVVESEFLLRGDAIRRRGWVAVPFETVWRVPPRLADRLAASLTSLGYSTCVAASTEGAPPEFWELRLENEWFTTFNRQCSILGYLLTMEDAAFAMLCTHECFNILAGPKVLVESVLGCSLDAAWREFKRVFVREGTPETKFHEGMVREYGG